MSNQPSVTGTFYHPCQACGRTVEVVDTVAQAHVCLPETDPRAAVCAAYWAGHDRALRATEQGKSYPYPEGNALVIGPECFIDSDRLVISYQGEGYHLGDRAYADRKAATHPTQEETKR